MFERMAIRRLLRYADECRRAKDSASDPSTERELREFERLFQAQACELRAIHDKR
jgi:hypothetical protein